VYVGEVRRALWFLVLLGASCAGDDVDPCLDTPTYERGVRDVLDEKCTDCHHTSKMGLDRNGAPDALNFDDYATLANDVQAIAEAITSGRMPPRGDPEAPPGTSDVERDLVQDWRRCGFPED
jgi:uncharacterized membrane protein